MLLGYLAFRGIQNDRALLEKERLNEHRTTVQQITTTVDEKISAVEGAFLDSIANNQMSQETALLSALERLKKQHAFVEEFFFCENTQHMQLPLTKLLFLPDASAAQSLFAQPQPSRLLLGQQYEFQQKRYQEALTSYLSAFAQLSNHESKGEALNAIARVQKKSNLFLDAIKSYQTIAQDYSDVRMSSGLPSGLAARLELGNLFLAIDDSTSAVETLIDLYQDLIHQEWALEKSQYEFLAHQVEESIDGILSQESLSESIPSYQSNFNLLKGEEKRQREITERLLTFQQNAAPNLLAKVPRNMDNPRNAFKRFALEIGGYSYLVSILGDWNGGQVNGVRGLLLNSEYLKGNLLRPVIQQHVPSEDIQWVVRKQDGEAILKSENSPSGTVTIKTNFVENFPPWYLELRQKDPRFIDTLLTSRRGVYFYMFILLTCILIFGLILTIRIITHELELGRMKSNFVSTVSHEFKSPLTSIRQLAEMLQRGRVPSEERRQRYYDVLLEQSERLSLLVDNILDFARMEEGRKEFSFEKVDIGSLLEEIVSTFQQRVRHEGFTIQAEIDKRLPLIQADSSAITQAVTNLIDNAIKYSGEAKQVYVRAFTENQYLIIAVQDFGIGIKPEEIDKVFERFYRGGDELTRMVKGSGLGLTLVKQIVQAHHGTVYVESEPGRGSTFYLRLPVQLMEDE